MEWAVAPPETGGYYWVYSDDYPHPLILWASLLGGGFGWKWYYSPYANWKDYVDWPTYRSIAQPMPPPLVFPALPEVIDNGMD